jgi:hypothetical protein
MLVPFACHIKDDPYLSHSFTSKYAVRLRNSINIVQNYSKGITGATEQDANLVLGMTSLSSLQKFQARG